MRSDYERKRFQITYWVCACIFLCIFAGVLLYCFQEITWTVGLVFGMVAVFLVVLNLLCYRLINRTYQEIEQVSGYMISVMERDEEIRLEEYKEGTIGILYSNFEKMVCALQQSRGKALSEKMFLRDIISDISHQLKTPLASLNVFMDLLLEDKVEEPEKRKQILKEAQNQLNRMEWMVLSMLKLARIEAGAIQFEEKEVLLPTVLLQAKEGVLFLLQERHQELSISCDDTCILTCDRDWLVEALINLLKNASDYSGENKAIAIEVEQTSIYTRIYVKDEGPGIAQEDIPHIFERFYRVNQAVNPNSVGIGLSLTKSIVEGMGGSIHVESEVGAYTWFVITFVQGL